MILKRILLTGDDGYNSIGIRVLTHLLKEKFELIICATKVQQSGVGGKLNMSGGFWAETKVDGVKAIWVNGSPADAMELANAFFPKKFDLVLSGINLGPNLVGDLASGTLNAAVRAVKLKVAPQAIAFSWNAPASLWHHDHNGKEDLSQYFDFPGQAAKQVISLALKNNFWDCSLLNVNFPDQPSDRVKFTRFAYYYDDFYQQTRIDKQKHTYFYPFGFRREFIGAKNTDADALRSGFITITPCRTDLLNEPVYLKFKGQVINLTK